MNTSFERPYRPVDLNTSLTKAFPFTEMAEKLKDYFLCLARVLSRKGIIEAVKISERLGLKLVVAGPGDFERIVGKKPSANIEVLGAVGPEERRDLLSYARGLFCLSGVHETFGMAPIEALLSGTVPIVANTGGFLDTVKSGYNGYRVTYNDIDAGVEAVENIDRIDPYTLRDTGLRYTRERCALQFNAYMQNLDSVLRSDGKIPLTEPDEVNYEKTIEWPDGWMTPVDAAKAKKEKRDVEDL